MAVSTADALDIFFLLSSGYLVFFMQCGFCMLSAGLIRSKNVKNIILKNLLDSSFCTFGWYFFGYAFAFGKDENGDGPGKSEFAMYGLSREKYAVWFYQLAFAATASTIVSGAVAERTRFEAYLLYAFFLTSWVYPNVVHWVWSPSGWLSASRVNSNGDLDRFNDSGMIDFSGCGVVHMVGGLAGLAGAAVVGPRIGRYDANGKARDIPGHSASLALLGVFILWFGWYGFNPPSALTLQGDGALVVANCTITTTLSAGAGCVSALFTLLFVTWWSTGNMVWDVIGAGNGALAGLVGITASCAVVEPWAAIVIGIVAGIIYVGGSKFVAYVIKVDDPLDAVAVHAFCGAWGLIAAAAFCDEHIAQRAGYDTRNNTFGFFVGGDGKLLVSAIVGIIVITAWVLGHMFAFFYIIKILGLLRVSSAEELEGLDVSHHGGTAYPTDTVGVVKVTSETQLSETPTQCDFASEMDALKEEIRNLKAAIKGQFELSSLQ